MATETGKTITPHATLSTPIGDGFGAGAADGCFVSAVNIWSVLSRMRTKREDFVGSICAATAIFLNVC